MSYTAHMWNFVYVLKNQKGEQYVGHTSNLRNRLKDHNDGSVIATCKKRPWHIEWFCGFRDEKKAIAFEKHMKTGSGSAFRFKHFVPRDEQL